MTRPRTWGWWQAHRWTQTRSDCRAGAAVACHELVRLSYLVCRMESPDGTGFHLTFPVNNSIQSMNLKAYYNMTISTYNPNPYALYVDNLDVLVQVNVNQSVFDPLQTTNLFQFVTVSGQKAVGPAPMANQIPAGYQPSNSSQIGSAKYGSIVFPAKSNITYNMIFTLDWTPDPYVGVLKDPTVLEIAAACGITSRREPKQRYIGLHYVATATIGALKPLGFYPKTESNGGLWCPVDVSSDKISLLENKVQSGESVNDAIQEIWGIGA
ncbi:hypothetical protein BC830DRAFT_465522 [Chytriomyces sp. MP71]|nr:hypothetical protein BC830DRAFT_465522 [Chytriomyces sp. MP71]